MNTDSVLFVAPIQDILSLGNDARLNKPGTTHNNWSWRVKSFDDNFITGLKDYGDLSSSCGRSFENERLNSLAAKRCA